MGFMTPPLRRNNWRVPWCYVGNLKGLTLDSFQNNSHFIFIQSYEIISPVTLFPHSEKNMALGNPIYLYSISSCWLIAQLLKLDSHRNTTEYIFEALILHAKTSGPSVFLRPCSHVGASLQTKLPWDNSVITASFCALWWLLAYGSQICTWW